MTSTTTSRPSRAKSRETSTSLDHTPSTTPSPRRTPTAAEEVWGMPLWAIGTCGVASVTSMVLSPLLYLVR